MGWLLLGLGALLGLAGFADGYAPYGLLARPRGAPGGPLATIYAPAATVAGIACVSFVLLLTPTGSLPSPGWRWFARVAAALPVAFLAAWLLAMPQLDPESPMASVRNPFAIPGLAGAGMVVAGVASPVFALTMAVAAAWLVRPFRRGRGGERRQLRWLALAAALAPPVVLVTAATIATGNLVLAGWAIGLYLALLPLAITAAIARTVQAFSTRLRDQVDLTTLTGELLAVVDQTMQPTHASLWLRTQGAPAGAGELAPGQLAAVE